MRVPVLTAVSDALWEADLVAALERSDLGIEVVRRCVDLPDLLATAATGAAQAVLLSSDLRRLDREALARLTGTGLAVVGVAPPGDEPAERRLRQLGLRTVLPADAPPAEIAEAVVQAVGAPDAGAGWLPHAEGDPRRALPDLPPLDPAPGAEPDVAGPGRLVAVWGPTGAPGRTTVAAGLASEAAALGRTALLVDADVYGGVAAQLLGLLDEAPGLAAACRLANGGQLDVPALAALARRVGPGLTVLTGIARAERWPELRPSAIELVLALGRRLAEVTVVDCGFSLEQDEELVYDTAAPRRNGATLTCLEQADTVLAVGSGDPVGLQRLVRGLAELRAVLPDVEPRVVVNRLRATAVPGDPRAEIRAALQRYAGVGDVAFVPLDVAAVDAAVAGGRTLREAAPRSAVRLALAALAADVAGAPAAASARRRRWLARG